VDSKRGVTIEQLGTGVASADDEQTAEDRAAYMLWAFLNTYPSKEDFVRSEFRQRNIPVVIQAELRQVPVKNQNWQWWGYMDYLIWHTSIQVGQTVQGFLFLGGTGNGFLWELLAGDKPIFDAKKEQIGAEPLNKRTQLSQLLETVRERVHKEESDDYQDVASKTVLGQLSTRAERLISPKKKVTVPSKLLHKYLTVFSPSGTWDLYNIIEDSELGSRIALLKLKCTRLTGRHTQILEDLLPEMGPRWWLQRSRWIIVQTFGAILSFKPAAWMFLGQYLMMGAGVALVISNLSIANIFMGLGLGLVGFVFGGRLFYLASRFIHTKVLARIGVARNLQWYADPMRTMGWYRFQHMSHLASAAVAAMAAGVTMLITIGFFVSMVVLPAVAGPLVEQVSWLSGLATLLSDIGAFARTYIPPSLPWLPSATVGIIAFLAPPLLQTLMGYHTIWKHGLGDEESAGKESLSVRFTDKDWRKMAGAEDIELSSQDLLDCGVTPELVNARRLLQQKAFDKAAIYAGKEAAKKAAKDGETEDAQETKKEKARLDALKLMGKEAPITSIEALEMTGYKNRKVIELILRKYEERVRAALTQVVAASGRERLPSALIGMNEFLLKIPKPDYGVSAKDILDIKGLVKTISDPENPLSMYLAQKTKEDKKDAESIKAALLKKDITPQVVLFLKEDVRGKSLFTLMSESTQNLISKYEHETRQPLRNDIVDALKIEFEKDIIKREIISENSDLNLSLNDVAAVQTMLALLNGDVTPEVVLFLKNEKRGKSLYSLMKKSTKDLIYGYAEGQPLRDDLVGALKEEFEEDAVKEELTDRVKFLSVFQQALLRELNNMVDDPKLYDKLAGYYREKNQAEIMDGLQLPKGSDAFVAQRNAELAKRGQWKVKNGVADGLKNDLRYFNIRLIERALAVSQIRLMGPQKKPVLAKSGIYDEKEIRRYGRVLSDVMWREARDIRRDVYGEIRFGKSYFIFGFAWSTAVLGLFMAGYINMWA
ncbi:MAG: hypothetical protein PHT95_07585, partial [Candidatus Omnitrophica bacterium]|nr:hypothetical protein [Candidatus Omnitrophota bacterium]